MFFVIESRRSGGRGITKAKDSNKRLLFDDDRRWKMKRKKRRRGEDVKDGGEEIEDKIPGTTTNDNDPD
jgi:hypothetical protein